MTRARFIFQMIAAYAKRFPGIPTKEAMRMAAVTYKQALQDSGIEFGDPGYDWDRAAAFTLVQEYEAHP